MVIQSRILFAIVFPQAIVAVFGFFTHGVDVAALIIQPLLHLLHLRAYFRQRPVQIQNRFADQEEQCDKLTKGKDNLPFIQSSHPQGRPRGSNDSQKLRALFFSLIGSQRLGNGLFSRFSQQLV